MKFGGKKNLTCHCIFRTDLYIGLFNSRTMGKANDNVRSIVKLCNKDINVLLFGTQCQGWSGKELSKGERKVSWLPFLFTKNPAWCLWEKINIVKVYQHGTRASNVFWDYGVGVTSWRQTWIIVNVDPVSPQCQRPRFTQKTFPISHTSSTAC